MSALATPVSAAALAPAAFSAAAEAAEGVTFDLRRLTALDASAVDEARLRSGEEAYLITEATRLTTALVAQLHGLPATSGEQGVEIELPAAAIALPRHRPPPRKQAETAWEKFAKEKGIQKRKKSRKVFDEATGEYKAAWGYQRKEDGPASWPIVEVKDGDDPNADPWTEARTAKRARVAKNTLQQARNKDRATGKRGRLLDGAGPSPSKVPRATPPKNASEAALPTGIPVDLSRTKIGGGAGDRGMRRGNTNTKATLKAASMSTASMGVFDEGTKAGKIKAGAKGLKATAEKRRARVRGSGVERGALQQEKEGALQVLRSVKVRKEKKDLGTGGMRSANATDVAVYDAIEGGPDGFRRKKGRGAQGKIKKLTRKQTRSGKA